MGIELFDVVVDGAGIFGGATLSADLYAAFRLVGFRSVILNDRYHFFRTSRFSGPMTGGRITKKPPENSGGLDFV
jgi:hypothetical protein